MKNILLLVHDDPGQEARLQAALDIVRAVEGHLTCVDVVSFPVLAAGDLWDGSAVAMVLDTERTTEAANRARLEQRIAGEGVQWSWIDLTGDLAASIERAATLNELIVVNRHVEESALPDMRAVASDLIVRSGKPVLAVPRHVTGFATGGRALVAWDGSPQADAALCAAVPLLRLAAQVMLLEIEDGSVAVPAEDAAAFLSRHDVHAEIVRQSGRSIGAADMLLRQIAERHADYVVMGGFGRSRIGEALLGGVTRTMLTRSPVPLFLAH